MKIGKKLLQKALVMGISDLPYLKVLLCEEVANTFFF